MKYRLGLQEYLPNAVQDTFQSMVLEFVFLPWKHAQLSALPHSSQQASQAIFDSPSPLYACQ